MSLQRSFWLHGPLPKQLKRDTAGHGEATINNKTTLNAKFMNRVSKDCFHLIENSLFYQGYTFCRGEIYNKSKSIYSAICIKLYM